MATCTALFTPRLVLTPSSPTDREDFISLERDPEVMRYLNGGKAVDNDNPPTDDIFLMPRGNEPHVWAVRRTSDNAFVGWFFLGPECPRVAEMGYRLHRSQWGHGYATEAASALINWGFENSDYDKVMAMTMTVNLASRHVLEKLGFEYTRNIDVNWPEPFPGTEQGEVEYVLTRATWQRQALR